MSKAPELKPCPFCGSDMQSFAGMVPEAFAKGQGTFSIGCDCEAVGPFRCTMEAAVTAWNTRAADDLVAQKLREAPVTTARALEVIMSRLKFDRETTRILKTHLTSQREQSQ